MGNYKQHIKFYWITVFLLVSAKLYYFSPLGDVWMHAIGIIVGMIYSIMPDIDSPSSKISRIFYVLIIILFASSFMFGGIFIGLSIVSIIAAFIFMAASHRGFFHSISAGVLLSAPVLLFDHIVAFYCFCGYLSHLILDREVSLV